MSCQFPGCSRHGQSNGYCIFHAQYAGYAGEVIERKAPNKKSEKQAKLDKEYKKIVKEMLAADPMCEMLTPSCTRKAEGLHHMKRRGVNTLNRKYLKRSCNACNGYVEQHPTWAFEQGLSLKVHIKQ